MQMQMQMQMQMLATILAFLAGFFIFVAEVKFVLQVLAAKADVSIFNHTLALCLLVSGKTIKH